MVKTVNKNVENLQILKNIVGCDQFNVIVERLTGEHIYFNKRAVSPSKAERDVAIKDDFFGGLSTTELADKYNLTIESIYKIVENKL
jgi:Mor family transcriptional regulator